MKFPDKVLDIVSSIPEGEVMSYKHIAKLAGKPKACRWVANICASNQYPLIIPCHRVVSVRLYRSILAFRSKVENSYDDNSTKGKNIKHPIFTCPSSWVGGYVFGTSFKYELLCFEQKLVIDNN